MPSAGPSFGAKFDGHVATILSIAGSSCHLHAIGDGVAGDVAQRRDHVADGTQMPGTLTERVCANADAGASWPTMRLSMTARGDCTHILVVGATGHSASTPASGSRMMPLANDDAALFGLPGRTVTVGSRSERPSMKPLRVMS